MSEPNTRLLTRNDWCREIPNMIKYFSLWKFVKSTHEVSPYSILKDATIKICQNQHNTVERGKMFVKYT